MSNSREDIKIFNKDNVSELINDGYLFDSLVTFEQEHFAWPWKKESWECFLESNRDFSLSLMFGADGVVGFCLFELFILDMQCHLYKIVVSPQVRGQGVSINLFDKHLAELRGLGVSEIYLEVEASNERAMVFYEKYGLARGIIKKRFYQDGSNAIVMTGSF